MYFSTFSLVARDPETGYIGVAGTSNGFAYGSVVPHVEAGVGAIATQAAVNLNYAAEGILELREKRSAQDTMVHLLQNDPDEQGKYQVLIMDNEGNTACHTGANTYDVKAHICQLNFACAGNTLVNENTVHAMAAFYHASSEPFALKMIKTLQAGHEAGGDVRGIRSAAVKIVKGHRTEKFWEGVVLDIRTDNNKSPLEKLEQLYISAEANILWNKGYTSAHPEESLSYFQQALALDSDNPEYMLWVAKKYNELGNETEAKILVEKAITFPGHWKEYWKRLNRLVEEYDKKV